MNNNSMVRSKQGPSGDQGMDGETELTASKAWQSLLEHADAVRGSHILDFIADEPQRFEQCTLKVDGLFLDYSKNRCSQQTLSLLFDLAREREVEQWRDRMFAGDLINFTEKRPVLHTALRHRGDSPVMANGEDVMPLVRHELQHMRDFVELVRNGKWTGYSGKPIRHVVNIGIGGSDLGPKMLTKALQAFVTEEIQFHFVSNIDGTHVGEALKLLDPETTLFIIASKSFTTEETMLNANTARDWFLLKVKDEKAIRKHFVAVSTNVAEVNAFGIDRGNMFEFWDWVGGRYSLWSSVGLSLAIAIGMDAFEELLDGASIMDEHFRSAPLEQNMPAILALLGIWYHDFFDAQTYAIFPYDQYLRDLPMYLQQADMESNGKYITRNGERVDYATGPIIWGEAGVNGQHSFFQLLHQGSHLIPVDFIAPVKTHHPIGSHHDRLMANCFAQSEALAKGRTEDQAREEMMAEGMHPVEIEALLPHKVFPGNHPSNTILLDKVTPTSLGCLLALYEHKVFVQGTIWGVNSFDQWGVELGKKLAASILNEIEIGREVKTRGPSTNGLVNYYLKNRN